MREINAKKNLKRHSVTAHNSISTTAVCCDQEGALHHAQNSKGWHWIPRSCAKRYTL